MPKKYLILLGLVFTTLAIAIRLLPHPWNFTPLGASILFAGFILPKKWLWLPLAALLISDLIIGTYDAPVMIAVYLSYAILMAAAYNLRGYYNFLTALVTSLGGAILFFFITNAAVWLWSGMYQTDFNGLMASYAAGLPFFRNSLSGDLFYSAVFFGVYELAPLVFRLRARLAARA